MDFLKVSSRYSSALQENGAPDDLEAVIVGFLDAAQFSLDLGGQANEPRLGARSVVVR
jgi:hypothetical protein